ncbi:Universal stress protein UspA [Flavobacterium indicum GPTSA100-9 = DSM 17447]|uniref:Universal stress protein UspA n=1 Tax=Flavobacterium indicum (strain DSM 17447 / CIP 109464 / GPTSA100-9) TaxID=1094466 RepID=H8XP43_FLAIG|nr:universal stress protein [Flavobacterium indicum]CCG52310.1 Universal stress protein UspA [Flavobacterium indicum GPTSA100-9 = DSM 17447]
MKTILVPTDFSKHAEHALKVAAQIAKKNNGKVILLHMLELQQSGNDAITTAHDIPELMFFKNAAVSKLDELVDSPYLDGIEVTSIVQFHMAFHGIIENAEKHNVDLIVMGSHGASGFQEMFIGSNAEKVVRNSTIPVLIIKKDEENFKVDNLVFASDFSDEIKKPFAQVIEFAKSFDSHIKLVNITTPNNFTPSRVAEKKMNDFIADFNFTNYSTHIYNDINVEKGILHFAKDSNSDVIGMCTHGRKGLAHFFNGSISEDLVNHSKRPVVTFKI